MLRIEIDDNEKSKLRLLARQEIGRVSERIHFVLMAASGKSAPEIAPLMDYDADLVRTWLKRYVTSGVTGLQDQVRSGRPPKQPYLDSRVEAQISPSPDVNGYLQSVWTVALMVLHLATRFKTKVSISTVRRALHRIRFSWKRPKLAPARRVDPDRVAKEAYLAAVLADPDPQAHIVAIDECDCHLLAVVRSMWQRIGLAGQLRLPTPGQNRQRSVFGSLNLRTGAWHDCVCARKCTADFIRLLIVLLAAYPIGPIYVIADNCKIHCSRALFKWLALNPRLHRVYLCPPTAAIASIPSKKSGGNSNAMSLPTATFAPSMTSISPFAAVSILCCPKPCFTCATLPLSGWPTSLCRLQMSLLLLGTNLDTMDSSEMTDSSTVTVYLPGRFSSLNTPELHATDSQPIQFGC